MHGPGVDTLTLARQGATTAPCPLVLALAPHQFADTAAPYQPAVDDAPHPPEDAGTMAAGQHPTLWWGYNSECGAAWMFNTLVTIDVDEEDKLLIPREDFNNCGDQDALH